MGTKRLSTIPVGMGIPTTEVEKEEAMDKDKRPYERDPTRRFWRGFARGNFGSGNGRRYLAQSPFDRNERYNQAGEWSDPASEGRRRDDTNMYFPTAQGRHQGNIPPPAPAPWEDRFFMDCRSDGSRFPCERPPAQNVPAGETLLSCRTGDAYEVEQGQTTPQSS